jgi:hypothetical protein
MVVLHGVTEFMDKDIADQLLRKKEELAVEAYGAF